VLLRFDLRSARMSEVVFPPPSPITAMSIGRSLGSATVLGIAASRGALAGAGTAQGGSAALASGIAVGVQRAAGQANGASVATAIAFAPIVFKSVGASVGAAGASAVGASQRTTAAIGTATASASASGVSAGSDPFWSDVALLVQGSGQTGDLAEDVGPNRFTISTQSTGMRVASVPVVGGVAISTIDTSPFLRSALIGGERLPAALSPGSSEDFTFEFEVLRPDADSAGGFFEIGRTWQTVEQTAGTQTNYSGFRIGIETNGSVVVGLTGNSQFPAAISSSFAVAPGQWVRVALARKAGDLRLLIDGAVRSASARTLSGQGAGATQDELATARIGQRIALASGSPLELSANVYFRALRLTIGTDRTNGATAYDHPRFPLPVGG
jgi:hypothetical protein